MQIFASFNNGLYHKSNKRNWMKKIGMWNAEIWCNVVRNHRSPLRG